MKILLATLSLFAIATPSEKYQKPVNVNLAYNQPQKAIDYYQQVILEFPESQFAPESLWRIGNLYNQVLHKSDLAITAYEQVVNQYPSCSFAADSIYQTALIYCQANRFKLARTQLRRVISHYPSFWKMYAVFRIRLINFF